MFEHPLKMRHSLPQHLGRQPTLDILEMIRVTKMLMKPVHFNKLSFVASVELQMSHCWLLLVLISNIFQLSWIMECLLVLTDFFIL